MVTGFSNLGRQERTGLKAEKKLAIRVASCQTDLLLPAISFPWGWLASFSAGLQGLRLDAHRLRSCKAMDCLLP